MTGAAPGAPLDPRLSAVLKDVAKLALTALFALSSGWVFSQFRLPVPYMLGSLIGVWVLGGLIRPAQPWLGVPRWFHIPVILGLGVIVGGAIGPGFIGSVLIWWPTTLVVIVATTIATAIGFLVLWRLRRRPWLQALLSAVPGGQAEVSVIARDYVDKDYAVVLSHLVRVTFIFLSTPLILALVEGQAAVEQSYQAQDNLPGLFELPPRRIIEFLAMAFGSYALAWLIRMPMPHLLGPMLVSLVLNALGWVETIPLNEFVLLAQVTIGGQIGARLSRVPFREVLSYLIDGLMVSVVTLSIYAGFAVGVAVVLDMRLLDAYIGFVPGGLYEVTLLSVLFGLDVAFVAFHNTLRVVLIYVGLPFVLARTQLADSKPEGN
ncbi:MAG: AbrB family transcriptional regulator [Alphaproteobacteria bacterium]|nr:AbrB family transcriptional regulator [Alphaproteobacteria bacterium]